MDMTAISVRQLIAPTTEEVDRVSAVFAKAFWNDPFLVAAANGDPSVYHAFMKAHVAAAAIAGEVWIASRGDTEIAGAATWFQPGRIFLDSEEQHKAGYDGLEHIFGPEKWNWFSEYLAPRYNKMCADALGPETRTQERFLHIFGVHPDHQGQGVGSSLIKAGETKASAEGSDVVLETGTPQNLAMYQRWGYVVKGQQHFESPHGEWDMWVLRKHLK
ncbi:acyl-CoA N-acyltransferase [Punctularia strigosozonata HHB-11173 SS5]|uniref:acyl-CoA N-acyltransferase n=1 Tax=Punctularia strigosozonata (strain HHB-11173) TaxID=741275 RepID=UPI0004416EAE|nr:acyl-CoA N-acyltransferase [Punctularia strigosozonata HHB-11173 SS5]EIN06814.1 acyl-CoA N-acyltransferase [Punctularia strigosozonata HHB-11173 SS5]